MSEGIVKWFNLNKGYGFIAPDDGGNDAFVHISDLQQSGLSTLDENQRVSFDLSSNKGKVSATDVKLIG